jgi:hypothetical protein
LCRSADMKPHQSQAFILDVFPVAQEGGYTTGTSAVHDRYMTGSTDSVPEGDTGNPCDMMTPLVQRPDPRAGSLATAPCVPVSHPASGEAHSVTASVKPR